VSRLKAGDPETEAHFSVYFERFLSLKLGSRRLSAGMSDDVRQETLYRVLKTLRQGKGLEDPRRLGAFVNGVCNNVLLEFLHKKSRDTPVSDAFPEMKDTAILADESLVTAERKKVVEKILKTLSVKDQEILRLVFFEEVDREEIARRLGTNSSNVRVLLHRAKARFEEAFQKSYGTFAGLLILLCYATAAALTIWQMDSWIGRSVWTTTKL
jgi:RNA polymerase sigma-70 factor (ECF subfamily)